ncbi:hypothetical protein MAPG_10577 [Magnaporthiopsis poae ATCC 64411]|uniref:Protein kinase domain-containing protein n=1 Tax=Magnaporthiopsis poae (strain ATCC 64411 / 73-15) TaxID=644358 RepID=A0A0C4ECY8_MAGP6|nr:hypothetical protein MAPG_10577 [Magnaporthiopsis poae ATCC 64411]
MLAMSETASPRSRARSRTPFSSSRLDDTGRDPPVLDRELLAAAGRVDAVAYVLLAGVPPRVGDADADDLVPVSRYREAAFPLQSIENGVGQASHRELETLARQLLHRLVRLAGWLHQAGIVHNDICLATTLEASDDMSRSKDDCRRISETVREYLGALAAKLPRQWLGNRVLDSLRERSAAAAAAESDDDPGQPIRVTMPINFQVPYNAHYGLFNVGYLRMIAPASFDARQLRPYLSQCLEIRGHPAAQGVYLPLARLDELLELMRLRGTWWPRPNPPTCSPVDRATNMVHVSDDRVIPFSTFLSEFSPKGTYLNTQVAHSPEWLVHFDEAPPSAAGSCAGSVSLATSGTTPCFRFSLGKRPAAQQPPKGDEAKSTKGEKEEDKEGEVDPLLRTRAWLETETPAKKRRV